MVNSKRQPEIHKDLIVLTCPDYRTWLNWLAKNHEQAEGIWLKFAKKDSGVKSISYVEAREGAIIYGWIDGLINGQDDRHYLTRFTQRRKRSKWSKLNREIAEQLIIEEKMMPSGLAQIDAAKQDGRWESAYAPQSTIRVPPELKKRLAKNKKAKQFFDSLSKANRYAFLYRIHNAKRPETKQRHIDKTMEMLSAELVYHPKTAR